MVKFHPLDYAMSLKILPFFIFLLIDNLASRSIEIRKVHARIVEDIVELDRPNRYRIGFYNRPARSHVPIGHRAFGGNRERLPIDSLYFRPAMGKNMNTISNKISARVIAPRASTW
jgi:hypothetical protein